MYKNFKINYKGMEEFNSEEMDGIYQMIILKKGKINKILSLFHWE